MGVSVTVLNPVERCLRQPTVKLVELRRLGDELLADVVQPAKQLMCGFHVIPQIHLAWMNGVVSDDAKRVEGLLNEERSSRHRQSALGHAPRWME